MELHLPMRKRWAADKSVWVYNIPRVRRVFQHAGKRESPLCDDVKAASQRAAFK